ncbi:MAG: DNA repair protein RadC [Treponema sp.]|nr:DNA repair protein RadC [Treponema sp.]
MKQNFDLRKRVLDYGLENPTDVELLTLILQSGTKEHPVEHLSLQAMQLIEECLSAPQGIKTLPKVLMEIPGVGRGKALALAAAVELGRRLSRPKGDVIRRPAQIMPYIKKYASKSREYFLAVVLSGGGQVLSVEVISVGSQNRAKINIRDVFTQALKLKAAGVVLCHNHPSGNCNPSMEDIETTKLLVEAAKVIGLTVLDHLIVNEEKYFSFLEHNLVIKT